MCSLSFSGAFSQAAVFRSAALSSPPGFPANWKPSQFKGNVRYNEPRPSCAATMMGCKTNSLTCLQGGKPGLPVALATDSTATLNKLALATGGTEKSWYRCVFPFGIVSLVIGIAATCITFTINGPQMDIAKVVSVATLIFGVGLLVAALVCWRAKRERQRKKQQAEPVSLEQGAL
uniref:Uncharacterized protein n=1 Tax=Sphaerodactylus townsendi TaxID=933632 RepID=A0ACB8FKL6_9SAUR